MVPNYDPDRYYANNQTEEMPVTELIEPEIVYPVLEEDDCLDFRDDGTCQGKVEYHTLDGLKSWPRCAHHFDLRMLAYEDPDSLERYANSDVAPSWFDPADAGERWDDDY